jgi:hypothetical protein
MGPFEVWEVSDIVGLIQAEEAKADRKRARTK